MLSPCRDDDSLTRQETDIRGIREKKGRPIIFGRPFGLNIDSHLAVGMSEDSA